MTGKLLYILRHAKSAYPMGVGDHDRPLSERGLRDAGRIFSMIEEKGIRPDLILCSTAKRAQMTFDPLRSVFTGCKVEDRADLYHASANHMISLIKKQSDKYDSMMLVGHNPGMHDLLDMIIEKGHPKDLSKLEYKFKTGSLAVLSLKLTKWTEISPNSAVLDYLFEPKSWTKP